MATKAELRRALRAACARFADELFEVVEAHGAAVAAGPSSARGARVRRGADALEALADAVLGAMPRAGAVAISSLARAVGKTPSEIARPLARLVAAGRVTRTGERRGARYARARARGGKRG